MGTWEGRLDGRQHLVQQPGLLRRNWARLDLGDVLVIRLVLVQGRGLRLRLRRL
jgi:hypothetical protein